MIVIIDYGVGNIGSILNMLKKLGCPAIISSSINDIEKAEKLILPGVGAFDTGMSRLNEKGFVDVLTYKAHEQKVPILGICLGMQLMTKRSEEGELSGLGWFEAETIKFKFPESETKLKIPNMGWNYVDICKSSNLFKNMFEDPKFYFVHSYYVKCNIEQDVLAKSTFYLDYVSAFEKDNIFGVQFHPEKSHKYGLKLLKNFSDL